MPVDMFERRFREELGRCGPFVPNDARDGRVWSSKFPAWHAVFSSQCLYCHSTGYRLPSFDAFSKWCEKAYTTDVHKRKYARFFEGDLRPGMLQRMSAWYEAGMAELYLYVCLVEAIEDKAKCGIVLYDPRADWKLKADTIVIINDSHFLISAFVGAKEERAAIEAKRAAVELERKENTLESSHFGNTQLNSIEPLVIALNPSDAQVVNGVRLFKLEDINSLLEEIFTKAGCPEKMCLLTQ